MESIKKPETIISLINTTAILGVAVYFYRRVNGLEQEIDKHTQHLATTINKVKEMQVVKQHIQQLAGAIREMNNVTGSQKNELIHLRSLVAFQNDQIKELQAQTTDLGGSVKLLQQPYFAGNQQSMMNQPMNQNQYEQRQPMANQQSMVNNRGLNQNDQNFNVRTDRGTPSQTNLGGYNNGNYQNLNNNFVNPGNYQNQNNNFVNPGYNSGGYQNNPAGNGSLIDLGGLDFGTEPEENEVDDQIDAVRRAKQNSNGMQLNL